MGEITKEPDSKKSRLADFKTKNSEAVNAEAEEILSLVAARISYALSRMPKFGEKR